MAGQCLDAYQSAERVLVTGVEERLTAREREQLALGYRAALAGAPTRPHPRTARRLARPNRIPAPHLWDGVLDAVDSRPGVTRPD